MPQFLRSKRSYRRCHGILELTCFCWFVKKRGWYDLISDDHVGRPGFWTSIFYWKKINLQLVAALSIEAAIKTENKQQICRSVDKKLWQKGWKKSFKNWAAHLPGGALNVVEGDHEDIGEETTNFDHLRFDWLKQPPRPRSPGLRQQQPCKVIIWRKSSLFFDWYGWWCFRSTISTERMSQSSRSYWGMTGPKQKTG